MTQNLPAIPARQASIAGLVVAGLGLLIVVILRRRS